MKAARDRILVSLRMDEIVCLRSKLDPEDRNEGALLERLTHAAQAVSWRVQADEIERRLSDSAD